jgi:glycosyltransferase involved in cell wall biosynthesis
VAELLEDGDFDVIHFHNVSLLGGPAVLALGHALKLYTMHEHWLVCPMHVLWRYDREPCAQRTCVRCQLAGRRPPQLWRLGGARDRFARHVDRFLSPSRFTLEKHRELGFRAPIVELAHFVNPPAGEPDAPSCHPRPYFLFVGRLERLKGAHALIDAFREVRDWDLVIAGDGNQRAELEEQSRDLPHVHLLGRKTPEELGAYYRHALATVVPSLCFEVFGLTAAESCAVGTPILVHDLGALPELARDAGAGLTYRSSDELVACIRRLGQDAGLRRRLGKAAREAYLRRWTRDRHLDAYERTIQELRVERA